MDKDDSLSSSTRYDQASNDNAWRRRRSLPVRKEQTLSNGELSKADRIIAACEQVSDIATVAMLATSKSGLLTDELRRLACMFRF